MSAESLSYQGNRLQPTTRSGPRGLNSLFRRGRENGEFACEQDLLRLQIDHEHILFDGGVECVDLLLDLDRLCKRGDNAGVVLDCIKAELRLPPSKVCHKVYLLNLVGCFNLFPSLS